jgi:beta-N-acetylhexosaminidase
VDKNLKAIIIDASGTELTPDERALFTAEKPAGFILFKRNCVSKQQVKNLVASMRECVGRDDIPVLIDQEGGDVSRLKSPEWREYPAAKTFAASSATAARENSRLMALDLIELGITVNCAPVVDVPSPECHAFLSASRTYSDDADQTGILGEAVCRGLLDGHVTPVIKHIPGHGRATVDSHLGLPIVTAPHGILSQTDFKPFKYLANSAIKSALWAMAAHVVYSEIDSLAATMSPRIVDEIIRGEMGFAGVLLADDISMKALGGTIESRVAGTLASGMDLTMLCNASFDDRVRALAVTPKLTDAAVARMVLAEQKRTMYDG